METCYAVQSVYDIENLSCLSTVMQIKTQPGHPPHAHHSPG